LTLNVSCATGPHASIATIFAFAALCDNAATGIRVKGMTRLTLVASSLSDWEYPSVRFSSEPGCAGPGKRKLGVSGNEGYRYRVAMETQKATFTVPDGTNNI